MSEKLADRTVRPRAYATILTHVERELASLHRTEVAVRLARDFGARLIGLGAEALEVATAAYGGAVMPEWVVAMQEQISDNLERAEAAFRRDAVGADIEWRSVQDFPSRALMRNARAADLLVVSAFAKGTSTYRTADPAEVAIGAGRPVLIMPKSDRHLVAQNMVVAWKDTREARRAVADAMPFLERAEQVLVLAVSQDEKAAIHQVEDVADSMKRHGVRARAEVVAGSDWDVTTALERAADAIDADLIVAGAYGHNRLTEWVFGGVTDDLLRTPGRFVLTSH